jgi:hypothetical protein
VTLKLQTATIAQTLNKVTLGVMAAPGMLLTQATAEITTGQTSMPTMTAAAVAVAPTALTPHGTETSVATAAIGMLRTQATAECSTLIISIPRMTAAPAKLLQL